MRDRTDRWCEAAGRNKKRCGEVRMTAAATELREFIDSTYGNIVVHQLLPAANKHVVFGKSDQVHPRSGITIIALTGGPLGGLVALKDDMDHTGRPVVSMRHILPENVVEAAVKYSHMEPEAIMPWLLNELDKIADSIP